MNRKGYYILGGVLLLAFAGFSLASFKQTLTPYVTFAEARTLGRTVQVAGGLEKGSTAYDTQSGTLSFNLQDKASGDKLRIAYKGLRPANFEDAISIVAIGRFDSTAHVMHAEKLLVKCPSKYQGAEVTKTYGS